MAKYVYRFQIKRPVSKRLVIALRCVLPEREAVEPQIVEALDMRACVMPLKPILLRASEAENAPTETNKLRLVSPQRYTPATREYYHAESLLA